MYLIVCLLKYYNIYHKLILHRTFCFFQVHCIIHWPVNIKTALPSRVEFRYNAVSLPRCYMQRCDDYDNLNRLYTHLTGELWGAYCENFRENWPRYNGTVLYKDSHYTDARMRSQSGIYSGIAVIHNVFYDINKYLLIPEIVYRYQKLPTDIRNKIIDINIWISDAI